MRLLAAAALLGWAVMLPSAALAQAAEPTGLSQIKDTLGNLFGGGAAGAAAPGANPSANPSATPGAAPAGNTQDRAALLKTAIVQPSQAALNELKVDRACTQVQERMDVWEKLAEYGGANAQLRLQALISSDLQQSELSEADRKMLKYLAYTTVWVPASVETSVGKLWAALSSAGDDQAVGRSGRTQQKALARLAARLEEVQAGINGFPGKASLVLKPDLADGASAKVGGLIVVSPRFLALMDETDGVRDVVLAHELAHLYKRHTIKELQYNLVSSAQGWQLAKRLLGKTVPTTGAGLGAGGGLAWIGGVFDGLTLAKDLFEATRWVQQSYGTEQELEADVCALKWLAAAGTEPRAAWQAFAVAMAAPQDQPAGNAGYASMHPSPAERSSNIEAALKRTSEPAPARRAGDATGQKRGEAPAPKPKR